MWTVTVTVTVTVTEKVGFRNTLYALVLRTAVYVFCCLSRMPTVETADRDSYLI